MDFKFEGAKSTMKGGAKETKEASPIPVKDLKIRSIQKLVEKPHIDTETVQMIIPIHIR